MTTRNLALLLLATHACLLCAGGCGATVGTAAGGLENFGAVEPANGKGDRFFRSDQPPLTGSGAERFKELVRANGVRTIVKFNGEQADAEPAFVREQLPGVAFRAIPTDCGEGVERMTRHVAEFISLMQDPAGAPQPALVHCAVGRDRTGLYVASYRILVQGVPVDDARKELRDFGHNGLNALFCPGVDRFLDRLRDPEFAERVRAMARQIADGRSRGAVASLAGRP